MFEDVRHERSSILLLLLLLLLLLILLLLLLLLILLFFLIITDPDVLKQFRFKDDEIKIIKNLAVEKLQRQECLEEQFALHIKE